MSRKNPTSSPHASFLQGPVQSTVENLDDYRRAILAEKYDQQVHLVDPQCEFKQLFLLWVDEHQQSFLRRFALRDMLRAAIDPSLEPSDAQYFVCQDAFSPLALVQNRIVKDYGGLAHLLETRPTLNREFCSELEYILGHRLVPEYVMAEFEDFAIGVIANLPEDHARKLWAFLPITNPGNLSSRLVVAFDEKFPGWLRSQLYDEIAQQVVDCVNYWQPELNKSGDKSLVYCKIMHKELETHPELYNVITIVEFIRQHAFVQKPNYQVVTACLQLLEDKIPDSLSHLSWLGGIDKIAPRLDNPQLAYRCVRRSLLASYHAYLRDDKREVQANTSGKQPQPLFTSTDSLSKRTKFLWAYGFVKAYAPQDAELIEVIESLIRC